MWPSCEAELQSCIVDASGLLERLYLNAQSQIFDRFQRNSRSSAFLFLDLLKHHQKV